MISTKALRAAGLTDAQIVAVREAELMEHEERERAERERQRIKKRNQRSRQNVPGDAGDNRDKTTTPDPTKKSRIEQEKELFDRGKEILGRDAGGLIVNLLRAKEANLELARAAIETASTKQSPREYIGAVIKGGTNGRQPPAPREHSQEWRREQTSAAIGKLRAVARGGGPDDRPTFDGLWPDDKGPSRS